MRAETRHQLKTDRFTQATLGAAEATAHWTSEHKSKLLVGTGAAIVIAAVVIGSWYYMTQQNDKANLQLTEAVRTLQTQVRPAGTPETPNFPTFASSQDRGNAAKKQLQAVIDQYPHTHTADIARYLLGTTAVELGDKATAERELKEVASLHDRDLASLAQMALAAFYGNNGRGKEAIELYKQLIEKPSDTVGKVMAQMQLASFYETSGQGAEAKKLYEQVVKDNPRSEAESIAQSKLQAMK